MLKLTDLHAGSAVCYRIKYQPTGGAGAKVFPATYSDDGRGTCYALETRMFNGEELDCVIVDSVPSQANRLENALSDCLLSGTIDFPAMSVDLSVFGKGQISSLELPHRIADAYFLFAKHDEDYWKKSKLYKSISASSPRDCTSIYQNDLASLLFGCWFSHDKSATARFARIITSEVVGINVAKGVKSASRLDPLGADTATKVDGALLQKVGLETKDKKPKDKKLSELGFGNVLPTVDDFGGVTCDYVLQTATISLTGLKRLSFPVNGKKSPERDEAGRAVLASLALVALESTIFEGMWLRSGCDLFATKEDSVRKIVGRGPFENNLENSLKLFASAVKSAKNLGLEFAKSVVLDGNTEVLAKRFEGQDYDN